MRGTAFAVLSELSRETCREPRRTPIQCRQIQLLPGTGSLFSCATLLIVGFCSRWVDLERGMSSTFPGRGKQSYPLQVGV